MNNYRSQKKLYQAVINTDDYKFEGFIVCDNEDELKKELKTLKKRGLKEFGQWFYG